MDISDLNERIKALDTSKSFLVEAPAGSGKTELLTQRFLALLAIVDKPESIVAITFTKKAQSEMHRRIIDALKLANEGITPENEHKKKTFHLAKAVLKRDDKNNWQLLNNPNRLEITTIDALSLKLTSLMPEKSSLFTQAEVSEDIESLYNKAIENLLSDMHQSHPKYTHFFNLLNHLDNNLNQFSQLIINMLKTREQWLGLLLHSNTDSLQQQLENNFQTLIKSNLSELLQLIMPHISTLEDLCDYSSTNLGLDFSGQSLNASIENLPLWQFLINHLLTTKDNKFKKRLTKNDGFNTDSTKKDIKAFQVSQKEKLINVLSQLDNLADADTILSLSADLKSIRLFYDPDHWQILHDITEILILSASYLKLTFYQNHKVDFNEIAINALTALGDENTPTDLMLYLDYKIEHLLIDEFQDTSQLQYKLINALTEGWQKGDGRSLFLVGDPMQSIYRFRQAEVELFLNASEGIGDIQLESLRLKSNFRSDKTIIDWVNHHFKEIFPLKDKKELGAISYRPSQAVSHTQAKIELYTIDNDSSEAKNVIELILHHQNLNKQCHIGILARSRSHLAEIISQLKKAHIPYNETEIEALYHQCVIEDLLALTEVILYPFEQLSWTKLLTSRLFGIDLNTLEALMIEFNQSEVQTFGSFLLDGALLNTQKSILIELSDQFDLLKKAISERLNQPISALIENLWLSMKAFCYYKAYAIEDAQCYFSLLKEHQKQGHLNDFQSFKSQLQLLRSSKIQASNIDVMTIHKSKGLEFDVVILPGLNKALRSNQNELLNYDYYHDKNNIFRILLATKPHSWDKNKSSFYQLLNDTHKRRLDYEARRLLYVAVTRAKSYLYCFGQIDFEDVKLKKSSLLSYLYPSTKTQWQTYKMTSSTDSHIDHSIKVYKPQQLIAINRPNLIKLKSKTTQKDNKLELFDSFKIESQMIGNITHFILEKFIKKHLWGENIPQEELLNKIILQQLKLQGACKTQIDKLKNIILKAVKISLRSKKLINYLENAKTIHCEYKVFHIPNKYKQKLNQSIIDLLIFDHHGNAVIIDYKTASPSQDSSVETFILEEVENYQNQLKQYYMLINEFFSPESIKGCLYFPLIDHIEAIKV